MDTHVYIRPEHPDERAEVYRVNSAAFPDSGEAFLVERLRFALQDRVSLVAEVEDKIVVAGLETCVDHGDSVVVVVGHPEFDKIE